MFNKSPKITEQVQLNGLEKHQVEKRPPLINGSEKEAELEIGETELAQVVGGLNLQLLPPSGRIASFWGSCGTGKTSLLLVEDEADALFGKR